MGDEPRSVGDILDRLGERADQGQDVSVGDMVEAFGSRSYGPFLLVPALIEMSPIGGIPGVPTLLAAMIVLFAAQIVFGREHLWLPGFLERRKVASSRVSSATDTLQPVGRFMDRWFHGRLTRLTRSPFRQVAAGICALLCFSVPPLEFLPFASTIPMAVIAAFGLALLVRDGVLMIVALAGSLAALVYLATYLA